MVANYGNFSIILVYFKYHLSIAGDLDLRRR